MSATITPLPTSTRLGDPASHAALADLVQFGLAVARVVARLAQAEDAALDALTATATTAAENLATPPASLDDARRAGHDADLSEAARTAAVARVTAIAESFDRAARAVRRTVALQARLVTGRPFQLPRPGATQPALQHRPEPHKRPEPRPDSARDADPAEQPDRPESGDELGAATDEKILRGIRYGLSAAASNLAHLDPQPDWLGVGPPPKPAPPNPLSPAQPGPALPIATPPHPPPAPDT